MNTTLKKLASIALCCGVTFSLCAGEDMLKRMHEIFGKDPIYDVGDKNLPCPVREIKRPGENYKHFMKMNIAGAGRSVTKRSIEWFNTKKAYRFNHETTAFVSERILSTEQELQDGIIKSEFTLRTLNEVLLKGDADFSVGALNSKTIVEGLKEIEPYAKPGIKKMAETLIGIGMAMLATPDPTLATQITAVALSTGGVVLRFSNNLFWKTLGERTNDDNTFKISGKSITNIYPGAEAAVVLLRNLQGSTIYAEWEWGKGYTKLEISCSSVKPEDKELLGKMIYRLNPIGARHVFPKGNEAVGSKWTIKASEIGGMLMTTGLKYDTLTGDVAVVNLGSTKEKYDDEKNEVTVYKLSTFDRMSNEINFKKDYGDNQSLACSFVPHGELKVVAEDGNNFVPLYIRNLALSGQLKSRISETDGLLKELSFDENTIKIFFSYSQLRMLDGAAKK